MRIKVFHITYVYYCSTRREWCVGTPKPGDHWYKRYSSQSRDGDIEVANTLAKLFNDLPELSILASLLAEEQTYDKRCRYLDKSA